MGLFRQELSWHTSLSPDQVREVLAAEVKPAKLMAWDVPRGDPRPFRGDVGHGAFRIIRRIQYRNSFAPVLEGRVSESAGGSRVDLSLYVHEGVMTFVGAWSLIAGILALWVLGISQPKEWGSVHFALLLPLLAPACAWALFVGELPGSLALLKAKLPPSQG